MEQAETSFDPYSPHCGSFRRNWASPVLILFTRYPVAGQVKTRLIPTLGAAGAAKLQEVMTGHAVLQARCCAARLRAEVEVRFSGCGKALAKKWLGAGLRYASQAGGDLGWRISEAFADAFRRGAGQVVVVGCDCPRLNAQLMSDAFAALSDNDLVLGPAADGGYYLIALKKEAPFLFSGVDWGSGTVCETTRTRAAANGLRTIELEKLSDVDRPEDMMEWDRIVSNTLGDDSISVVIPTLNEETDIAKTLRGVMVEAAEVIVADGGSSDNTIGEARRAGACAITVPRGRAAQMNAGALAIGGSILLFLHADTHLPCNFSRMALEAMHAPGIIAGAFSLKIGSDIPGARLVEKCANLRSRLLQLPYGDQALFMRRGDFLRIGGYANLPIMEDFEFAQRLRRRGQVKTLEESVLTSGRRWNRLGVWNTTLINQMMIAGYGVWVPPSRLASLYRMFGSL